MHICSFQFIPFDHINISWFLNYFIIPGCPKMMTFKFWMFYHLGWLDTNGCHYFHFYHLGWPNNDGSHYFDFLSSQLAWQRWFSQSVYSTIPDDPTIMVFTIFTFYHPEWPLYYSRFSLISWRPIICFSYVW